MEFVVELSAYAPCNVRIFTINGKEADTKDFGEINEIGLGDYACGLLGFTGKGPTIEILAKYKITAYEYYIIVKKLNAIFNYGVCDMCE